jgi:hypothetical protein
MPPAFAGMEERSRSMIELLKGLIGAELTLVGVPNQALPDSIAAAPQRALPRTESRHADDVQEPESKTGQAAAIKFSESDYRSAAG